MKPNPNQQSKPTANSGRLDQSWSTMINVMKEYHGSSQLPTKVPTKTELINGFMTLPACAPVQQISEAASAFQFRKCFAPSFDKKEVWQSYKEALATPSPPVDLRFHEALLLAAKALPANWDKSYAQEVRSTVPSFKANLEGLQPHQLRDKGFSADAFKDACLGHRPVFPIPIERKCKILNDRGKARTITIASVLQLQLRPLHRVLQAALFKTGTVLQGPPTPTNMRGMTTHPDEVFVSGDYKAATDGFNLNNSVYAIQVLRETSSHIPSSIWDLAEAFLSESRIRFYDNDGNLVDEFDQESGQLMGNFLSFPLLCFINLAGVFLGLGKKRTQELIQCQRLKINGDDIIFRSSIEEYQQWRRLCPIAGLNVSVEKTLVHKRVFTLNSFYFTARPRRVPRVVWVYRASAWHLKVEEEKLSPQEKRSRRCAAVNDVIGVHLDGICNAEKRNRMRYLLQKVHAKKVEGSSLTVKLVDRDKVKEFQPEWRRLGKAVMKSKIICSAVRQVGVQEVKFKGTIQSHIRPKDRHIHREVTQHKGWGREKIDTTSNFTYTARSWGNPKSIVNQEIGKGVGRERKKWGSFWVPRGLTTGDGLGFKGEKRQWWYHQGTDAGKIGGLCPVKFVNYQSHS